VILVEHRDLDDPELDGPFTLKVWKSTKRVGEAGSWTHERIELCPDSTVLGYEPIVLGPDSEGEVQAVAEMVEGSPRGLIIGYQVRARGKSMMEENPCGGWCS